MIASCDTPGLLPISQALEAMLVSIVPISQFELVELLQANNKILANDVISPVDVPPADNSAMDGYALRAGDLQQQDRLELIGTSMAGTPFTGEVGSGQCVRIMTGAIIPEGADSVVMQENTKVHDNKISFLQKPDIGNNIRRAGEDIATGSLVLEQGCRLVPAHLSLLASIGIPLVAVLRPLKVGLIATGDELTAPGQALQKGGIYESNRYALHALLSQMGSDVIDFGIVKDDKESIREAFIQADEKCDVVISSGGVSVGDADYVKEVLQQIGQINFWKVAIKPGKPFAFGKLNNAWFCGLPGNPVSSYVTFQQLVVPVLRKLAGENFVNSQYFIAEAATTLRKRPGRTDYQRGIFYRDETGKLLVKPNGKQGSGIMSSIASANCYIVLAQDSGDIAKGQDVRIQPFSSPVV
ncbi:MAG: molybdopterin molybdotransferase [Paraglaciecola sp.]|jgi:molybdopterin molybdotransferase